MASKFGLHGSMEHVTLEGGRVEGVFQPYGTKKVMTKRGEKFASVYELTKSRRQQAQKAAARPARAHFARVEVVNIEEFNLSETTPMIEATTKGGWAPGRDGKSVRSNTVEAKLALLGTRWGATV